jgi:hypothetical protein
MEGWGGARDNGYPIIMYISNKEKGYEKEINSWSAFVYCVDVCVGVGLCND